MKKVITSSLFALCLAVSAENLVAHWNFAKGINSVDGKYKMQVRGGSSVTTSGKESFLKIADDDTKAQGIIAQKRYQELSPKAFRTEVKFRITRTPKKTWLFLLDNKYLPYEHKPASSNKGFLLYFLWNKQANKYAPCAAIGLGTQSLFLKGSFCALEMNKIYTISFSYNGKDAAEFKLDGKVNQAFKGLKGGPVAPAGYATSIGDRLGGTYFPFNGDIMEVKLFSAEVGK